MQNLIKIYIPLCDKVVCYDNSESEPVLVFEQDKNGQRISKSEIYKRIIRCANGYKRNS
jgi:predicted ABC-type ATPase